MIGSTQQIHFPSDVQFPMLINTAITSLKDISNTFEGKACELGTSNLTSSHNSPLNH
jgi:hypothetical protein